MALTGKFYCSNCKEVHPHTSVPELGGIIMVCDVCGRRKMNARWTVEELIDAKGPDVIEKLGLTNES